MENKFIPKNIESTMYKNWEEKGYFKATIDKTKKPFVIVMPPPNVTGKLHMGHALDDVIQDVLIRYNRMKGVPTLWVPGTDHASIATEVKVLERLKSQGKTKDMLGREGFLKEAWAWKEEFGNEIKNQVRKLGASCDWTKERFTMDEVCTEAVLEAFIKLYEKNYIYKGERIVNWCPSCKTSISETEVEYKENEGNLWHIRYKVEDSDEYLTVATTRPETMLGDTAVAVYPSDERYKHLIGKNVLLPLTDRKIPVVADEYVEKEFGTGVVKITPAHDPNDFMVGQRHKLPRINIMNEDGSLNELAGKYKDLDRFEARKQIVEDLQKEDYLVKVESHNNNVGTCYRCHSTIEPYLSLQWFVKMEELVKPALEAVRNDDIRFIPKRFEKQYFHWMENIQDWCISRQLWWGHRIPAYYCDSCDHITISKTNETVCKCGGKLSQDEDTLDTWFSSALWPFSVFGWPNNTEELDYFYPTSTLVTGYDIIPFWVSKMIFSGFEYTNDKPFENVYIHGLVRDANGLKMSKSLGNGIDPIELIEKYGTDALRFSLVQNTSAGNDIKYSMDRIESAYTFTNKLWNAAKFVDMYLTEDIRSELLNIDQKDLMFKSEDKWIINKLNTTIINTRASLDKFDLGMALNEVYSFIWDDFCDWYIEMVKPRLYAEDDSTRLTAIYTLNYVLKDAIKLIHPYIPFITEEIYQNLVKTDESIMISDYPEVKFNFESDEFDIVTTSIDLITAVRNIRSENNITNSKKLEVIIVSNSEVADKIKEVESYIKKLLSLECIVYKNDANELSNLTTIHLDVLDVYIDLSTVVNKEEELSKLKSEKETALKELNRAKGMLSNEKFVSKAPAQLIEKEKEKIAKYELILEKIEERIANM